MAAVQRTPTPVDIRSRRAFIESMEEELKKVHEHLDRRQWKQRNGGLSTRDHQKKPQVVVQSSSPRQWYTLARSNPATSRKMLVEKEAETIGLVRVSSAQDKVQRTASVTDCSTSSSSATGSKSPTPEPNDVIRVKSPSVPLTSNNMQLSSIFTSSSLSSHDTEHSQESVPHQNKLHDEYLYSSSLQPPNSTGTISPFDETPLLVKEMPFGISPLPRSNTIHSDDDEAEDNEDNKEVVMPSAFGDLYMDDHHHRPSSNELTSPQPPQQQQQQQLSQQKRPKHNTDGDLMQHTTPTPPPPSAVVLMNRKEDDDEGLGKSSLTILENSKLLDDNGDSAYDFHRYQRMQALKENKARSEMLLLIDELKDQLREKENDVLILQERMHVEVKVREDRIKKLTRQNARSEKEKWDLLKKARDAAERSVHVKTKLDLSDNQLRSAKAELDRVNDELASVKAANKSLRLMVSDLKGRDNLISRGTQTEQPTRNNSSFETVFSDAETQTTHSSDGGSVLRDSMNITDNEEWEDMISITSSQCDTRDVTPINTPKLERGKNRRSMKKLLNRLRRTSSTGKHHSTSNLAKSSVTDTTASLENLRLSQTSLTSPLNYSRSSIPQANRLSTVSLQEQYDPSRVLEDFKILPFSQWNTRALVAWMELVVGMPHYISNVRQHVTSGHAILALTNADLEKKLNITNSLHRRRLRLYIEEYRTQPPCPTHQHIMAIDHNWVAYTWAVECGLPHVSAALYNGMVNGKVLNSFSKEELKKYLKITKKVEQLSFLSGVELLRMHDFDREAIKSHRQGTKNPLYWTNSDVCEWLLNTDLEAFANNVTASGVHGALLFLERGNFTSEHLANIINIPPKSAFRKVLANQLAKLFSTEEITSLADETLGSEDQLQPSQHLERSLSPSRNTVPSPTGDGSPHPMRRLTMAGGENLAAYTSNPDLSEQEERPFTRNNRDRISLRESMLRSITNPLPPGPLQRPATSRSVNQRPVSQVCSTTTV